MSQTNANQQSFFQLPLHRLSGAASSTHEICRLTGIEPARLRFIEVEFKEFFKQGDDAFGSVIFDHQGIDLLRKIHDALFQQGKSISAIRGELQRTRKKLRTIVVTSGKGGVGKTTVSVNLAIAIARQSPRVLLFDADMGLGNVHVFAGVAPRGTAMDLLEGRAALDQLLVSGPENVQILCGGSGNTKLADLDAGAITRLGRELERANEAFDTLIIDTGAGISSHVTHFLAMADDIIVVTTPNIAATLDAYGVIKVARENSMRGQIHLLVNQADDEKQSLSVHTRISDCAARFLKYTPASLGYLTRDRAVEESNQSRRPLLISNPDHENAGRIRQVAERLGAIAGVQSSPPRDFCETPAPH